MNTNQPELKGKVLLSIITVCFNSASTIIDTLNSVKQQKDTRFEYIVIDGGSSDGTVSILQGYLDIIDVYISEKDNGIYDAMNKGLKFSCGRFVLNLNSDDYLEKDAIKIILNNLENLIEMDCCIVSGVTKVFNSKNSKIAQLKLTPELYAFRYKFNPFPHPSTLISRNILLKCDGYNGDYRIAADYDMFLRASLLNPSFYFIDSIISNMRSGGVSGENQKLSTLLLHQIELFRIQYKYISIIKSALYLFSRLFKLLIKKLIRRVP